VEASERNGWGQWHRGDEKGIGMNRTVATGTGFIGQYRPPVAKIYESIETCPDELLLFMHHVPYTHVLKSGKTVIQHIYDTHYEGAQAAEGYVGQWKALEGRVDEPRYLDILKALEYQAGHAQVWRDAVNTWFLRTSGIKDLKGRAGNFPGRHEAEKMALRGYAPFDVERFEAASGSQAVACKQAESCSASMKFGGKPGWYGLSVRYFDENDGAARYRLYVNTQLVEEWVADDWVPTRQIDSHSSARRLVRDVALRPGDEIRIEGLPDVGELAGLDYIEIVQ
jgi:alpha-glucuronidase